MDALQKVLESVLGDRFVRIDGATPQASRHGLVKRRAWLGGVRAEPPPSAASLQPSRHHSRALPRRILRTLVFCDMGI